MAFIDGKEERAVITESENGNRTATKLVVMA